MGVLQGVFLCALWIATTYAMPVIYSGVHVRGGQQADRMVDTIEKCLAACATVQCAGFDFNSASNTCWLHNDEGECGPLVNKAGCSHYRFISCQGSIFEELNKLVNFPDHNVGQGTLERDVDTLATCYALCRTSFSCVAFDWDARFSACWTHTASSACSGLRQKPGCTHYRLKTTCDASCAEYEFRDFFGYNRPGGVQIAGNIDFEQCKAICAARQGCKMVDYDVGQRTCWEHTSEGAPVENTCCRHSAKVCSSTVTAPLTTLPPTQPPTTVRPTTKEPNLIRSDGIDASGNCPAELASYPATRRSGGVPVSGVLTAEECKAWCLDPKNTCYAVDFNTMTSSADRCFVHAAAFAGSDVHVENNACCTQFRKISCAFKMCIRHAEKAVTTPQTLQGSLTIYPANEAEVNIDPAAFAGLDPAVFSMVPCDGTCSITTRYHMDANGIIDIFKPQYISRDCNAFQSAVRNPNKNCFATGPAPGKAGEVVTRCACSGDKCNAFGNTITRDCIAYYPFDGNTLDLTPNRRNGDAFKLLFEGDDVAKNWSAKFTGNNYLQIGSFADVLLGSLGGPPNFVVGPFFTISLWFKLTEVTNNDMTLLSNGVREQASVELYTMPVDATSRLMVGTATIDGTPYTVVQNVKYGVWTNLMFMVTINPVQNKYSLKLVLTEAGGFPTEAETLTAISSLSDRIPRITQQGNPLCIGKQYIPSDPSNKFSAPTAGEFYRGLMDELYIFGVALDESQMKSVRGVSYDPRRFNP